MNLFLIQPPGLECSSVFIDFVEIGKLQAIRNIGAILTHRCVLDVENKAILLSIFRGRELFCLSHTNPNKET